MKVRLTASLDSVIFLFFSSMSAFFLANSSRAALASLLSTGALPPPEGLLPPAASWAFIWSSVRREPSPGSSWKSLFGRCERRTPLM